MPLAGIDFVPAGYLGYQVPSMLDMLTPANLRGNFGGSRLARGSRSGGSEYARNKRAEMDAEQEMRRIMARRQDPLNPGMTLAQSAMQRSNEAEKKRMTRDAETLPDRQRKAEFDRFTAEEDAKLFGAPPVRAMQEGQRMSEAVNRSGYGAAPPTSSPPPYRPPLRRKEEAARIMRGPEPDYLADQPDIGPNAPPVVDAPSSYRPALKRKGGFQSAQGDMPPLRTFEMGNTRVGTGADGSMVRSDTGMRIMPPPKKLRPGNVREALDRSVPGGPLDSYADAVRKEYRAMPTTGRDTRTADEILGPAVAGRLREAAMSFGPKEGGASLKSMNDVMDRRLDRVNRGTTVAQDRRLEAERELSRRMDERNARPHEGIIDRGQGPGYAAAVASHTQRTGFSPTGPRPKPAVAAKPQASPVETEQLRREIEELKRMIAAMAGGGNPLPMQFANAIR